VNSGQIKLKERDGTGATPLIFAIDCGATVDVCKKLVKAGCDINA
jgi:ankyrin repeat protein